jgi:hypothetical protein
MKEIARQFLDSLLLSEAEPEIDWPLFRLLQIIEGTAGSDAATRERLVGRGLEALAVSSRFDEEVRVRSVDALRKLFRSLLGAGWRFVDDFQNPMWAALAGGPLPKTTPHLKRFLEEVAEVMRRAEAVTVVARSDEAERRLVTLLFVDEKYVGFLPGSRAAKN